MKFYTRTAHPRRPARSGATVLWMWLLVAICSFGYVSSALAQPTTVRLDIRKAEVIDQKYFMYFTFLDGSRQAIKDVSVDNLAVLSADRQKAIPVGQAEVERLKNTPHAVAVMFVVANYKAFNQDNANTFPAIREFVAEMEPRTDKVADLAGVVYYGNTFRDISFTYKLSELKEQVVKIRTSDDKTPRMFAALGNAIRRFEKEVATQKVDQRYIVLLTDGAGTWQGSSNPQAIDNKIQQVATSLKEAQINLLIIGHSATRGESDPSLAMLQQLANQSGGTYRGAEDKEQVYTLMKDAYNEIYDSHVLNFRSNSLKPGQNHKLRLSVDYKNLKAKSPPATIYVPAPEGIPRSVLIYGGIGCFVFGLLGVIGLLIFTIWRRRKAEKERAASEFDDYMTDASGAVIPTIGGAAVVVGTGGIGQALPPVLADRPEYSEAVPGTFHCKLKTIGGPAYGRTFYIVKESTTLGSSEESDLMVLDGTVSKKHAGIRVQDKGQFELHDFGSTNGVFINEARISKQYLKDGDRIRIGETEFVFSVE